jgi:hypothetical protein
MSGQAAEVLNDAAFVKGGGVEDDSPLPQFIYQTKIKQDPVSLLSAIRFAKARPLDLLVPGKSAEASKAPWDSYISSLLLSVPYFGLAGPSSSKAPQIC